MQVSEDQVAELGQLKEEFKLAASQNLDKLFNAFLVHLQKSKQYEDKTTQVGEDDFKTSPALTKLPLATDFERSPSNLVIDESTDGEQPPVTQQKQNCNQTKNVFKTKSKRSFENDNSDPDGIFVHIKEEILGEYIPMFCSKMNKKQKTTSESVKNNTTVYQNDEMNSNLSDNLGDNQRVEKDLKVARKNSKSTKDNLKSQADNKKNQQMNQSNDSTSVLDSSLEQGEINDQQEDEALKINNKQKPKDYKIQRFTKSDYALQPTGDKHHKFSIINLKCPIERCSVVLNTQKEMNNHLKIPHSYLLYTCPIAYCGQGFKNSNDFIAHGNIYHPLDRIWYCTKSSCNEMLDSADALVSHCYISHHMGKFLCVKCNFKGSSRHMMLKHYETEHNLSSAARYRTDFTKCIYDCNEYLSSKEQFDMHLLNNHNKFPFMCLAYNCNSSFKTNAELNSHLVLFHEHITNWKCPYNNCTHPPVESAKKLYKHMYNFHYQGRFSCMVSGCNFYSHVRARIIQHCENEHSIF